MKESKIQFKNTDSRKTSIVFTWDDNFARHLTLIAPEFISRGMRCTFYVNPGQRDFIEHHLPVCKELLAQGHEIGSHSFDHLNYKELPRGECTAQITRAISSIRDNLGVYPTTFAFPNHAYDEDLLKLVRQYHLETRNTLSGARWLGIETKMPLQALCCQVDGAINNHFPLVFAGHSAILSLGEIDDEGIPTGYEPILLDNLKGLLDYIRMLPDRAEVLTFAQAALKQYVLIHARTDGDSYVLSAEQMEHLRVFGMDTDSISKLL